MPANERLLTVLNELLRTELMASYQHFLHSEILESLGYTELASFARRSSADAKNHAGILTRRILSLNGMPGGGEAFPFRIGGSVREQINAEITLLLEGIPRLNGAIQLCAEIGDHGLSDFLTELRAKHEQQVDWLEAQINMMRELGVAGDLSQQQRGDDN